MAEVELRWPEASGTVGYRVSIRVRGDGESLFEADVSEPVVHVPASALAEAVLAIDTTADVSGLVRHATPLTAARMAGE